MLDAAGRPRPELLRDDGLHMTAAGYAIWSDALRPLLARYGFGARSECYGSGEEQQRPAE
jgi:hypothetical protein